MAEVFANCLACAASLVYSAPLSMVLPQGAQTGITVVDAERRPVALSVAQAGSQAVAFLLPEGGRAVLVTASAPGYADILLVAGGPPAAEPPGAEAVAPPADGAAPRRAAPRLIALSVRVEPARGRRLGDGPVTLELTLPSVEGAAPGAPGERYEDVSRMVAGETLPGWTRGRRLVGSKPYAHWVREGVERARVPTGWRLLLPHSGRRRGHEWRYTLWEAPAHLGRWQWRDENGRDFYTSGFLAEAASRGAAGRPEE